VNTPVSIIVLHTLLVFREITDACCDNYTKTLICSMVERKSSIILKLAVNRLPDVFKMLKYELQFLIALRLTWFLQMGKERNFPTSC
jgi:hypothetical protein